MDSITLRFEKIKFLENFDPERSNREKRKLKRKIYEQTGVPTRSSTSKKSTAAYNEKGIHIATGLDLCDCMNDKCAGCFYPCPKCQSTKCSRECRQNRRWAYDTCEIQGTDIVYRNPYA